MALDSFSALKTALADWLVRPDLASVIPDAIKLAEAEFTPQIRTREMEGRATVPVTSQFTGLPLDFLELRSMRIVDAQRPTDLNAQLPGYIYDRYGTITGRPRDFAIVGPDFLLGPTPDGTYTLELDYYAFVPLSDAAPTNWLLTKSPGVYLWGSLVQLQPYVRNDGRADFFQSRFDAAIALLRKANRMAVDPAGSVVARPRGATP